MIDYLIKNWKYAPCYIDRAVFEPPKRENVEKSSYSPSNCSEIQQISSVSWGDYKNMNLPISISDRAKIGSGPENYH